MRPVDINVNVPSVEEIKAHWQKHHREYLIAGGCLAVGFLLRKPKVIVISPVFNNNPY